MPVAKYVFRRPNPAIWSDFDDVSNRLSRFFDDSGAFALERGGRWTPPVIVSETSDELSLTAELPGLSEADVSIELENDVLSISGEKTETRTEGDEERRLHVVERRFGSFTRSFTLPRTVDGSNISATFHNGVLTVKLPKVAEAKARRIDVTR